MSKEVRHFKIEFKDYENLDVVEYKEYQKLYKENKRLNNTINKAIERILSLKTKLYNEPPLWLDELQDILEGVDK